jgi:multiple sugar transport system ATP-binding protein
MTMGDRIVVMQNGLIQQVGSPLELYNTPANLFVAGFIGSPAMNFLPCQAVEEGGQFHIATDGIKIALTDEMSSAVKASNQKDFVFGVRPEDISTRGAGGGEEKPWGKTQTFKAHVNVIETLGKETYLDISAGEHTMTAIINPNVTVNLNTDIDLDINMDKIHLFQTDGGQALF